MKLNNLDEAVIWRDRLNKLNLMVEAFLCGSPIESNTWCGGEKFSVEDLIDSREIKQAIIPLLAAEQARIKGALATLGVES